MKFSASNYAFSLFTGAALLTSNATAKLVAWYPLDESPASALPVTENVAGNDASLIGYDPDPGLSYVTRGVSSARQNLGLAYQFDKIVGAGGGFNLGAAAAVQPTDKFTISFFFQPQTFDAFDRFFETLVGNNNNLHGMRIDTGGTGNQVRVLTRSAVALNTNFTHPTVLKNDGTWYFFAFRYDSAGVDNSPFQLTLIEMNGDPVDEAAITAATSGPAAPINTGAMSFPHEGISLVGVELPGANNPNNINAVIDEYAFFDNSDGNGVLTDAQLVDVFDFGPSGVELISSFTTDLQSVSPGNPVTLSWEVDDSLDTLILDDGNGNTTDLLPLTPAGAGSTTVSPTETTTYSIRAVKGEAANVHAIRILAGAAPAIDSYLVSETLVSTGTSVDLNWSVTGADSLSLDPGAVDVSGLVTTNVTPATTTTFTLSATNGFGTTMADVTVEVIDGPVPTNRNVASIGGNTDGIWNDNDGDRNWVFTGGVLGDPLVTPSANTNITASYTTGGGLNGGSTGAYQYPQFSVEIWFRPGALTADHQTIFETGGGQNGLSALITDTDVRFLGSTGDIRTLDVTISTLGLNFADFVQLVITNDSDADLFTASLRDTFGNVRSVSESADVTMGGNGGGLFSWASGAVGGAHINLGGRTEVADTSPTGLTGFEGEIGIVYVYDQILDDSAIGEAFDRVATIGQAPAGLAVTAISFDDDTNELTLTWNSINGQSYLVEFSSTMEDETWFELDDPIGADSAETTQVFSLPPNQDKLFFRVVVFAP